jgi:hypothetical protein
MSFTISSKSSVLMSSTKSNLTPEQLQRMEENRLKALAKKQANSRTNSNTATENQNPISKINTIHTLNDQPKTSIFNNPSKINTIQTTNYKSTSSAVKPSIQPPLPNVTAAATSAPTNSSVLSDGGVITGTHGKCVPLEEDPENRFEIIIGYNKVSSTFFDFII